MLESTPYIYIYSVAMGTVEVAMAISRAGYIFGNTVDYYCLGTHIVDVIAPFNVD